MVEVSVVDVEAVEPPHVLRAGAIDFGQALPGSRRIHILDAGRLGDPGLFRAEQPHPQHPWLVTERCAAGPAEDDSAGRQCLPHDGFGLLAEERGVIGRRDCLRGSTVGAGSQHAAG